MYSNDIISCTISHVNAKIGIFCFIFAKYISFVMKLWCKHILLLIITVLYSCAVSAQDIPVLPADPAVRTGRLPNGTSYYIVENNSIKGLADFALVQKTGLDNIDDTASYRTVDIAREALSSLPRCLAPSVQTFFTSHGVTPGRDGFVKVTDNSTRYDFRNVLLSEEAVLDSTLLVILDVIDRVSTSEDPFIRKWYSPSDQAVIVAGDVDAEAVAYKLKMMSMMTSAVGTSPREAYRWQSCDSAVFVRIPAAVDGLAELSLSWRSPRPPEEYMNTVQPAIYEMFLAELKLIAEDRVKDALRKVDIPYAEVSCSYITGVQSSGDASFRMYVCVAEEDFTTAAALVAEVLSGIEAGGTDVVELMRAKRKCMDSIHEESRKPIRGNSVYVDKCAASFLYGGSLSTLKSKLDFLASRRLADSTELRLFNAITAGLLDSRSNLTVSCSADVEADSLQHLLSSAWKAAPDMPVRAVRSSRDIPKHQPSGVKMKIKTIKPDPMSAGEVWTFSNGLTVIYKKMDTGGRMYYNLARNSGFASIPDLRQGEGGYVSDQFFLSSIGGMPSDEFLDVLAGEGILMEAHVGLSYMMLSGYSPEDRMDLLMNSLLAAVNERVADSLAADYHVRCSRLSHAASMSGKYGVKAVIDSIMCPDYRYTPVKSAAALSPQLSEKADTYFRKLAGQTNDGVLIFVGDMDVTDLKKLLLKYVDGFRTTDRAFRRQMIRYQPNSGRTTYTVEGNRDAVDIAISVPLSMTADNYMAAEIAAMVLRKRLSESVVSTGMYLELYNECKVSPQERFSVLISMNEASPEGFATSVSPVGPFEALSAVRYALSCVADDESLAADVALFKSQLKSALALDMSVPFYWLDVISRRHLAGKDFTTNSQAKIDAVTPERVKAILDQLNKGAKVEYIMTRQNVSRDDY